jgi:large subunit ribosomal protein L31
MKKNLHPENYRLVVFQDLNNSQTYLTRSTVATDEKITLEGIEYPLVKVHITGSSHPFYTGEERVLDIEGRVDKFKARRQEGIGPCTGQSHQGRKSQRQQGKVATLPKTARYCFGRFLFAQKAI